ncbi:non-ribosomal peptide synthetase, partial [Pseudoalteromonas piscicida]
MKNVQLTSIQKGILIEGQLNGDVVNNIGGYQVFSCKIDKALYKQARELLIESIDALTLVFNKEKDSLEVSNGPIAPLEFLDFSAEADAKKHASKWVETQMSLPLTDVSHSLLEDALIKIEDEEYWYYAKAHHIIIDGWGFSVMMATFLKIYEALQKVPRSQLQLPPSPSFLSYTEKYTEYLESSSYQKSRLYWLERFDRMPDALFIPKEINFDSHSRRKTSVIEASEFQLIREYCAEKECNPVHFLLSVLYLFFYRTTSAEDMVVALPSHNRSTPVERGTVGVMVNVNPIRLDFTDSVPKSFPELLTGVAKYLRKDYRHNKFPIADLRTMMSKRNGRSVSLFDFSFNYQKLDFQLSLNGQPVETNFVTHDREQIPLVFTVCEYDKEQDAVFHLDYNLSYFSEAEGALIAKRFKRFLSSIVHSPDAEISSYPLLFDEELAQLERLNQTQASLPECSRYTELFEHCVTINKEKTAAACGVEKLTYDALNCKANKLARYLSEQGVSEGTIVGVHLPRSLDMLVALIAITKAGACYLPLDVTYPEDRLSYMVEDSGAEFILYHHDCFNTKLANITRIDLSDHALNETISNKDGSNLSKTVKCTNALAYVIYTSGSTGKPKGVAITHTNMLNLLCSMAKQPGVEASDKLLAVTPISFDIHVFELYCALIQGAQLVVATSEQASDGDALVDLIVKENITLMQATPASWKLLIAADLPKLDMFRAVIGGEALPAELVKDLNNKGIDVWNVYGPTETTVWSTGALLHDVENGVTIGRPFANTRLYVLDNNQQLVPPGVPGELYIGGLGVAHGYLNRIELTEERFIKLPFDSGKLFRTGDLVKWRLDAEGQPTQLDYLGRIDHQVKIRGFRVELGEIENCLIQQSGIIDAVLIAHADSSGSHRLVAYVINNDEIGVFDTAAIQAKLSELLPEYMVPGIILQLDEFPLTPSGKVDRKALPVPTEENRSAQQYIAPKNQTQLQLCDIWQQILEIEQVGIEDDFFVLGGHSLLAARVVSLIRKEMMLEIPLKAVFQNPTIVKLERFLANVSSSATKPALIKRSAVNPPVSYAQQRLWFIDRFEGGSNQYNMVGAFSIAGALDQTALIKSFNAIVERHEVLRTRFVDQETDVTLQVEQSGKVDFSFLDLRDLAPELQLSAVNDRIEHEAGHCFNLTADSLLRVTIIQ